jgi:hypothetical protein
MKIAYIGPKHISADCEILVPDHHITVGSLQSAGYEVSPLYTDFQSDDQIIEWCYANSPSVAVFGGLVTSGKVLACLGELKIPRVHLWWDHTSPQNQAFAESLCPLIDLNVVMDMTTEAKTAYPDKFIRMWYPLDRRIFYPGLARDIDVCFLGTILPQFSDRVHYLSLLEKQGYKIHIRTGVYREQPLKIEEYAGILRRSKIALNFTMLPQFNCHQSKTRTAEILHCGALLLESENEHTPTRFQDGEHYVSFNRIDNLIDKIDHYLAHEDERLEIAQKGSARVHSCYNEVEFWKEVFAKWKN